MEVEQGVLQKVGRSETHQDRAQRAAKLVSMLTRRQVEVLNGMADGMMNKQIAWFLMIDEKTVKMHRALLLKRLGVQHSAQAIRLAVEASFAGQPPVAAN